VVRQARSTREKCICAQQSNRAQHAGTGKITKARALRAAIENYVPSDAH